MKSRIASLFALTLTLAVAAPAQVAMTGCAAKTKATKSKGGGAKAAAAKTESQKVGGAAGASKSNATSKGESYEGVTCDASAEGLGWCDSDGIVVFCSEGQFYALDCSTVDGAVCAEDPETNAVDCVAPSEL